ncbi:MAG: ankyrin repeat domain-containing protein [Firmicutes bacterium]|nr:ankyrin repeat domain-containing protein [Bacillota bacterium]
MADADTIFSAIYEGNIDKVDSLLAQDEKLLEARDDKGFSPLRAAVQGGFGEIVEFLLVLEANPNSRDKTGKTPLHEAPDPVIADMLLARNADVDVKDDDGMTPLHYAVIRGQKEVLELLAECGADLNKPDGRGVTPLQLARQHNHGLIARILEEAGADE